MLVIDNQNHCFVLHTNPYAALSHWDRCPQPLQNADPKLTCSPQLTQKAALLAALASPGAGAMAA